MAELLSRRNHHQFSPTTMHRRPALFSALALASLVTNCSGFGPHRLSHHPKLQDKVVFTSLAESRSRETAVTDEIDLCTIEGSFCEVTDMVESAQTQAGGFSYALFAKEYPFVNNIGIATMKTAAADLLAQVAIAQTPVDSIDWERSFLFCAFGAIYLGGFQYLYQVNIFKKLFDVDSFTSQPWEDKLKDGPGLRALAAQTALDLAVLTAIYLPTFYIFKAGVFSGSMDPSVWADTGLACECVEKESCAVCQKGARKNSIVFAELVLEILVESSHDFIHVPW